MLLLAIFVCGLMLFGIYSDFLNDPLSKVSHILYQASSRSIWAISLSYIIYYCLNSKDS